MFVSLDKRLFGFAGFFFSNFIRMETKYVSFSCGSPSPTSLAVIVFFCCVTAVPSWPLLLFILLCEHSTQDLVS